MGSEPAGLTDLQALAERAVFIVVGLGFIALVIMLFVGAIKYITSGGDQKAIASATNTITWAILGLVFAALAWLILKLIEQFTGISLTKFCIGFAPYCL